jgi:hypothetical protein
MKKKLGQLGKTVPHGIVRVGLHNQQYIDTQLSCMFSDTNSVPQIGEDIQCMRACTCPNATTYCSFAIIKKNPYHQTYVTFLEHLQQRSKI